MKRARRGGPSRPVIRIGALYRDVERGLLVTAEDHEIQLGQRTGRIVVAAADGSLRFARRWLCRDLELMAVDQIEGNSRPREDSE
ncbi:MAG TPA: hypothetical protein VMK12_17920 [Anaeromyxobacteraceae bacterium]|nr:hypothetical protein [Anaeromyxobacteraceae bacterium]